MTNHVERQHQAALAKQKKWLKARRRVKDPVAAFLGAVLVTANQDLVGLKEADEILLVKRQQVIDALDEFETAGRRFSQALQEARDAEHWVRGSHRKTTPVAFRETAQGCRREPSSLARRLLVGMKLNLIKLLRRLPGAVCPMCEQEIRRGVT